MSLILGVKNLTVSVGSKKILNEVSFNAQTGKITALVGGSGSGKTTIANAILRLLPSALRVTGGQIVFNNQDVLGLNAESIRQLRGGQISMVFQEPLAAFNPLMTIGEHIDETLAVHTHMDQKARRKHILEILSKVQLPNGPSLIDRFPHQLSGGQRQRAMIAQAISSGPKLIIADEPTSNLDVTIQAKIMDLFRLFRQEGMTILLISHDLGLVSHLADDVVILENGSVVDSGSVGEVMKHPKHRYTKELMEAFA